MEPRRPFRTKINNLIEPSLVFNENVNKISTSTVVFFKALHVFFSWDLGFVSFKTLKSKIFFKIVSISQCFASCIVVFLSVMYYEQDAVKRIWAYVFLAQYALSVASISIISEKKMHFKKFYDELHLIDLRLRVQKKYRFQRKFFAMIMLPFLNRFILTGLQCSNVDMNECLHPYYVNVYFVIVCYSIDIVLHLNAFIFYLVYCRLLTFKKVLMEKKFDLNCYQHLYKSLIDLTENIMGTFEPVFVCALLANVPQVTTFLFFIVYNLKYKLYPITVLSVLAQLYALVQGTLFAFAPAIFAGMLASEANLLKVELHNLLLHENGTVNSIKLVKFIKYIEARPFKLYAYNIIPLNAHLVAINFNLCVTYFIVLVQIFHIND